MFKLHDLLLVAVIALAFVLMAPLGVVGGSVLPTAAKKKDFDCSARGTQCIITSGPISIVGGGLIGQAGGENLVGSDGSSGYVYCKSSIAYYSIKPTETTFDGTGKAHKVAANTKIEAHLSSNAGTKVTNGQLSSQQAGEDLVLVCS